MLASMLLPIEGWSEDELLCLAEEVGTVRPFVSANRKDHLAGRAALALLLRKVGVSAKLQEGSDQPLLRQNESTFPLYVSIAHTTGLACAAVSNSPVGIDVEQSDRIPEKGLRRIASTEEIARFQFSPITLWALKEAIGKMLGSGITGELKTFELKRSGNGYQCTHPQGPKFIAIENWEGYVVAVCSGGETGLPVFFLESRQSIKQNTTKESDTIQT